MQYRGYDSYGIAYRENDKLTVEKFLGPITQISSDSDSEIAIGHTRWATHGSINLSNTHPILYNDLAIVHNGIIENHLEIKNEFPDFIWTSETDTEVILALFSTGEITLSSFKKNLDKLEGSFAFVLIQGNKIYFARKGITPLYITKTRNNIDIISDISSIKESQEIIMIEDGQFGEIADFQIRIEPEKLIYINSYTEKKILEKKYKTWFEDEFFSQPKKISEALNQQIAFPKLPDFSYITGCGSAYLASLVGCYWLEEIGLNTCVRYPSELPTRVDSLILVSQSGETADTLSALEKTRNSIAIVNNENSSMAIRASIVLPIHMGKEVSVASTKATTGQMLIFVRWANHLGLEVDLNNIPKIMEKFINNQLQEVSQLAILCSEYSSIFVIGRGILYPIAMEAALKIKELAYVHAEGLCAAELKHGPLALIDSNFLVICLSPQDDQVVSEIRARGGKVIVFTQKSDLFPECLTVEMPTVDSLLLPFLYILPMQWLAYSMAKILGRNIDMPRNLAKSVTVG